MQNPIHLINQKQSGAVLLVGLIMVLLISIISISAIRGSNLQESIAGNMRERNLAFQSAESGLRAGERIVADYSARPIILGAQGLYNDTYITPAATILSFSEADWKDAQKVAVTTLNLAYVVRQPSYVIEQTNPDIGDCAKGEASGIDSQSIQTTGDCVPYRITARGFGAGVDSVKTLQSVYNRRFQ